MTRSSELSCQTVDADAFVTVMGGVGPRTTERCMPAAHEAVLVTGRAGRTSPPDLRDIK